MIVSDIMNLKEFSKLSLIAGANGLSKELTDCGILDYEFDSTLKDRYLYSNIHEGQMVLTSFLYAKENPFLIDKAIKNLVSKKASGIIIKNIYNLPIHDNILRYADSKNFPIFLINDFSLYFERIIILLYEYKNHLNNLIFKENMINNILKANNSEKTLKDYIYSINSSFGNHYFSVFLYPKDNTDEDINKDVLLNFFQDELTANFNTVCPYKRGFLLFYSIDSFDRSSFNNLLNRCLEFFRVMNLNYFIGISNFHHSLKNLKTSIYESFYAMIINSVKPAPCTIYDELGLYKILLPHYNNIQNQEFSSSVLDPLVDFDAENKAKLLETLIKFIDCDGNLHDLASLISQHENTLRYRFNKIYELTGLNYRNPSHYEQLSIAVKISICTDLINRYEFLF